MIISSASKFVEKINWWISFFTIIFWIVIFVPIAIFAMGTFMGSGPRYPLEALGLFLGLVFYLAVAFLVHRLSLIGLEFMKAIVTTVIECQQELKQIKEEINKQPPPPAPYSSPQAPSPYNY